MRTRTARAVGLAAACLACWVDPGPAAGQARAEGITVEAGKPLGVRLGAEATQAERRAADLFAAEAVRRSGAGVAATQPSAGRNVVIGTVESNAAIRAWCDGQPKAAALPADGFRLVAPVGAGDVYVIGQSPGGVVAGVGRLLRAIRFGEGRLSIPAVDLVDAPKLPIRGMYLWARTTYFTPRLADQVDRYIEEFALWGGNSLSLWFEMGMFDSFDDEAARAWLAQYRRHAETARRIGMKFGLFLVVNDAYKSSPAALRCKPILGCPAHYLCPSKPQGAKLLLRWQKQVLAAFAKLDTLILWPADPGGCACADCSPWATNGFWRAARPLGEAFHARFPAADVWLSVWHLQGETWGAKWRQVVADLAKDRPDWLTGLQPGVAPHHGLARVDADDQRVLSDSGIPLTVFPEVSMYRNHKGMLVKKDYWDRLRAEMVRYPGNLLRGGWPYSERWNTDVANVAMLCWFWEPQKKVDAVLDEYAAWYFGPCAPAARRLLDLLDDGNKTPDRAAKVQAALAELERELPDWAKKDWRWGEIVTACRRLLPRR